MSVLLLSLAMSGVGHLLLVTARSAERTSRLSARIERSWSRVRGAVSLSVRAVDPGTLDGVEIGESGPALDLPPWAAGVEVQWLRLGDETWWVRGVEVGAGQPFTPVSDLVWVLSPSRRALEVGAAVTIGPDAVVAGAGTIEVDEAPLPPRAEDRTDCATWLEDGDDPTPGSLVPVQAQPSFGVGLLPLDSLTARSLRVVSGRGTPSPTTTLGACRVEDPWNWGDPSTEGGACADHFTLVATRGSLVIDGGVGQGVLVAEGDVRFDNEARFHGWVLTAGSVVITGGASVVGVAAAARGLEVDGASRVIGSRCWAALALRGTLERLGRPVRMHRAPVVSVW